jgi:uncharacterized protein (DUF885 family)
MPPDWPARPRRSPEESPGDQPGTVHAERTDGHHDERRDTGGSPAVGHARFDDQVAAYLDDLFTDAPHLATFQGRPGLDAESADLSAAAIAERQRRDNAWLARLANFADEALDDDERIDRDLVIAVLRGRAALHDWQPWRRRPEHYLNPALMGVFGLFLRRPLPEPELVVAAEARLSAVPALLAAGRANLDPALVPRVLVERGLGQCRAGATYTRDLVPLEVADPLAQARLAEAGGVAAEAFRAFGAHLEGLLDRAGDEWAIGESRYTALLHEAELLDDDATRLHQRGRAAWAEIEAEMTGIARAIDPLTPDWLAAVRACGDDRPATPEEMRAAYERETARARKFLADHRLVTLPDGERCEVVPSPPFQRPVLAVASYFAPPAFAPSLVGRFNVPYPPEGAAPDDVTARLADNGHHAIPTITAHETYPGHHWHLTTMAGARPVRRVHRSPYFTEGWALYAEEVMREHGYFRDARAELMHLSYRLFRAARIVVDTALHTGDMTREAAVAHLVDHVGLTEPVARTEVARYCAMPTQAAAYLTGCLEIERMRDRWFAEGRGDLLGFHDTLAATGAMPVALAEQAALP